MENNLRKGIILKKKRWNRLFCVLFVMMAVMSLLSGGSKKSAEKEDEETITVYLWSTKLYEKYAPYIQEQLPDINIEFVVGNNDLDFYRFLNENGGLPDIITCCRFSLHDASPLKDSLMDLSTTNAAGAVYDTYLNNFKNEDGSVNWLPVCADAHGFVVNKDLFEKYDIPLPTDYESFVSACQAFDKVGIRGFSADYSYDYTCMETLQGLSASELSSAAGRKWRTAYSDPDNTEKEGLDSTVWPEAFERLEQFIKDTRLGLDDLDMNYDSVVEMYQSGRLAMYFGSSSGVKMFQDQGINTTFLPFFQENGEKWLISGDRQEKIYLPVFNPAYPTVGELKGWYVEDNGCVSINPGKYHRKVENEDIKMKVIKGLGYENQCIQLGEATKPVQNPRRSKKAAKVEYDFYTFNAGSVTVYTYALPVFPVNSERSTCFGIMIDDGLLKYASNNAKEYSGEWRENVYRNSTINAVTLNIDKPGKHTLKLICSDPGMIIQKVVIDMGGMKRSYLGPETTIVR